MAHTHLPDDLASWPEDPFELLGIEKGAEKRVAHRAYVRLIKKFKPDHSPAEFQRIHEAYEHVKTSIALREQFGVWDEDEDEDDDAWDDSSGDVEADFIVTEDSFSEFSEETIHLDPFSIDAEAFPADVFDEDYLPDLSDDEAEAHVIAQEALEQLSELGFGFPLDDEDESIFATDDESATIWKEALAGNYQSAYNQLEGLAGEEDVGVDVWMRLYWLLKVAPEVDPERDATDWLVTGLHCSQLSPPVLALYSREIRQNDDEGVSERCTALLTAYGSLNAKAELLQHRWRAASRLGSWRTVVDDLARVGVQRDLEDDECYARILLDAVDHLAWFDSSTAIDTLRQCMNELEEMVHMHQVLDDELHRADILVQVASATHRLGQNQWSELVRKTWLFQISEMLPEVESTLAPLAEDPLAMLTEIDALVQRSPMAMSQLAEFVERVQFLLAPEYDEEERDEQELITMLRYFFARYRDYRPSREALLKFCISESLDPTIVVQAADGRSAFADSWSDQYESDTSLRLVYAAYRAFES